MHIYTEIRLFESNPKNNLHMNWYLKVLRQYVDFDGRARRKEYWLFQLFNLIIVYGLFFLGYSMQSLLLYYVYVLGTLIPSIAVAVRRMHDVNKSGWFILIPIYNLILCCMPGTVGENAYGPDPKGTVDTFDFEKEQGAS